MLTLQDVMENKKRYGKLVSTNFLRMRTAVIDSEQGIMPVGEGSFLNLPEETIYKYLKIAYETFSKKVDDQMLSLYAGGGENNPMLRALMSAAAEELTDDAAAKSIYELIAERYDFLGKILVVLFYEAWDIPERAKDGKILEDAGGISKRIICSICPIKLTAPGLEFRERRIRQRERDWVVGKPEAGFLWPSWEGGQDCEDRYMYYTKDSVNPDHRFMEIGLGAEPIMTATEARLEFERAVSGCCGDEDAAKEGLQKIKDTIEQEYRDIQSQPSPNTEIRLGSEELEKVLCAAGTEIENEKLIEAFKKKFSPPPKMKWLLSGKDIQEVEKRKQKKRINSLMKDAAKLIMELSDGETELVEKLMAEVQKNR